MIYFSYRTPNLTKQTPPVLCVCVLHLASGTAALKHIVVILSSFPVSPEHAECAAHGGDQMQQDPAFTLT